jgi:hypothetical protein
MSATGQTPNGTWDCVRSLFPSWTARFEGRVRWLYLDCRGIPTTGGGWALPTLGAAAALPWTAGDGEPPASPAAVQRDYQLVLAAQHLAGIGGGQPGFERLTTIRLPPEALDAETLRLFDENDVGLAALFGAAWASAYADAQLVAHSMVYAMGLGKLRSLFPRFIAAFGRRDYRGAAGECHMTEVGNAPLRSRNEADYKYLVRAALAYDAGADPSAFYIIPPT